jgi:hypothetical protein
MNYVSGIILMKIVLLTLMTSMDALVLKEAEKRGVHVKEVEGQS